MGEADSLDQLEHRPSEAVAHPVSVPLHEVEPELRLLHVNLLAAVLVGDVHLHRATQLAAPTGCLLALGARRGLTPPIFELRPFTLDMCKVDILAGWAAVAERAWLPLVRIEGGGAGRGERLRGEVHFALDAALLDALVEVFEWYVEAGGVLVNDGDELVRLAVLQEMQMRLDVLACLLRVLQNRECQLKVLIAAWKCLCGERRDLDVVDDVCDFDGLA